MNIITSCNDQHSVFFLKRIKFLKKNFHCFIVHFYIELITTTCNFIKLVNKQKARFHFLCFCKCFLDKFFRIISRAIRRTKFNDVNMFVSNRLCHYRFTHAGITVKQYPFRNMHPTICVFFRIVKKVF